MEMSLGVKPRVTLETVVASCSTAPHGLVEEDNDVGDEEEAGVGDGVRVDVDEGVDM